MDAVRSVKDWRKLGRKLNGLDLIGQRHSSDDECLLSVIQCWLLQSASASWRRLIWTLDEIYESAVADPIRSWAEPVRDKL